MSVTSVKLQACIWKQSRLSAVLPALQELEGYVDLWTSQPTVPLSVAAVGTGLDVLAMNGHLQRWYVSESVASRGHCQHRTVTAEQSAQMHRENGMAVAARPVAGVAHVAPFSLSPACLSVDGRCGYRLWLAA